MPQKVELYLQKGIEILYFSEVNVHASNDYPGGGALKIAVCLLLHFVVQVSSNTFSLNSEIFIIRFTTVL